MPSIDHDHPAAQIRGWARIVVGLVALIGAAGLARQLVGLRENLPMLRLWPDRDAQYQRALGPRYEFLRAAKAVLPRDASVLLLTAGRDIRHGEYLTFHRALYFLAPRPVWWMAPAPPDGTWESRWWIPAPVSADDLLAIAKARNVSHLLAFEPGAAPAVGTKLADLPGGAVFALEHSSRSEPTVTGGSSPLSRWWPLRLTGALLVIVLLGSYAVALLGRCGRRMTGLEAAALAWTLGAGLMSVALLWLHAFRIGLRMEAALLTLAAVAGFVALRRTDRRTARPDMSPSVIAAPGSGASRVMSLVLTGVLAAAVLVVSVSAAGRPLTAWDSWVLWGMRARTIFLENGISPATYADPSRAVTLLGYPLLFPLLQAWIYVWIGTPDDRLSGTVSILFYAAVAAIAYSAARRRGARHTEALWVSVAVATIPWLVALAGNVSADLAVALFATVAAIYAVEWLEDREPGALIVASLAAGFLGWTKREGVILAGTLIVAILVAGHASRRARRAALAVAFGAALVSGPWYAFTAWYALPEPQFDPVTPARLAANLDRIPSIAWRALTTLLSPEASWIWPLAALFAILCRRAVAARRPRAILPITAGLYLTVMASVYLFSAYVPYQQHVISSYFRLAAHVVALPLLWIADHGRAAR